MSIEQLSQADLGYFKSYYKKMKDCHEKEFLQEADPDLMRALYRGKRAKKDQAQNMSKRERLVTLNRMFTTTNTVLPNSYYQNPRKIAVAERGANPSSAALMTSGLNHYMKVTNQKAENQEAVMNTWFMGLGWKKIGYDMATESQNEGPESELSMQDRMALGAKNLLGLEPDKTMHREVPEIIRFETLTSTSESPVNVMIDHKGDLRNFNTIAHKLPRTVWDLYDRGSYEDESLERIVKRFRYQNGSRFDLREMDVTLIEMMVKQRNGIWKLCWIEEFDQEPLSYDKLIHEGSFPWIPLAMTNEPGVRYPVAHMKVMSGVQEWIDNIVNLQVDILGKTRQQHLINEQKLSAGQKEAFKRNKQGGIIFTKGPLSPGDVTEITSQGVKGDSFNMIALFQQNLTEIGGATEQTISGKSSNKTLGQDQLADIGGQIRESGITDRIRDWMIAQARVEGQYLKQFSNAELHLQITPKDYADTETGRRIEETWVEFMTPRHPLPLRQYLEGEFDYRVNIYEAIKPDNPNIRRELTEAASTLLPLQPELLKMGKRLRLDIFAERIGQTFDNINSDELIESLDPRQVAAIQAAEVMMQNGGMPPQVYKEEPQEVAK